jgi:hypothetical protein
MVVLDDADGGGNGGKEDGGFVAFWAKLGEKVEFEWAKGWCLLDVDAQSSYKPKMPIF